MFWIKNKKQTKIQPERWWQQISNSVAAILFLAHFYLHHLRFLTFQKQLWTTCVARKRSTAAHIRVIHAYFIHTSIIFIVRCAYSTYSLRTEELSYMCTVVLLPPRSQQSHYSFGLRGGVSLISPIRETHKNGWPGNCMHCILRHIFHWLFCSCSQIVLADWILGKARHGNTSIMSKRNSACNCANNSFFTRIKLEFQKLLRGKKWTLIYEFWVICERKKESESYGTEDLNPCGLDILHL